MTQTDITSRLRAALAEALAERDAAIRSENSVRELMNCYNLGGWTDAERLIAERDESRREVEALRLDADALRAITSQKLVQLCSVKDCANPAIEQGRGPCVCRFHDPGA